MKKKKQFCEGCENIKTGSFPFAFSVKRKKYAIDTEGCGYFDPDDYSLLIINYCPVCGKKLLRERRESGAKNNI